MFIFTEQVRVNVKIITNAFDTHVAYVHCFACEMSKAKYITEVWTKFYYLDRLIFNSFQSVIQCNPADF